jgi:protein SCO1
MLTVLIGGGMHLASATGTKLTGTDLGHEDAPDFRLRDSSGQAYSLSQFGGKVVVLAFLYTQCPDARPITAELLRKADQAAGHPSDVVYVAVSVDPVRDNVASIAAFSQEHHLEELGDRFHYLIGSLSELSRVWQQYYIREADPPAPGQDISHVSSLYLIDKKGARRLLTHIDVPPAAIAQNERTLTK